MFFLYASCFQKMMYLADDPSLMRIKGIAAFFTAFFDERRFQIISPTIRHSTNHATQTIIPIKTGLFTTAKNVLSRFSASRSAWSIAKCNFSVCWSENKSKRDSNEKQAKQISSAYPWSRHPLDENLQHHRQ